MYRRYLLILSTCLCSFLSFAQDLNYTLSDDSLVNHYASIKRVYYATRTELKPKIDGKLDDACWQTVGSWMEILSSNSHTRQILRRRKLRLRFYMTIIIYTSPFYVTTMNRKK